MKTKKKIKKFKPYEIVFHRLEDRKILVFKEEKGKTKHYTIDRNGKTRLIK